MRNNPHAIIILAAGSSSRLGQPKQLLEYKGKTLLQHAVDEALGTGTEHIVVILGASAGIIKSGIKGNKVIFLENPEYEKGMASGISLGTEYLVKKTGNKTDAILIMLCDQPFVNSGLLTALLKKREETGAAVVASWYKDNKGVPAVFHRSIFPELKDLTGEQGAKGIIRKYENRTETVEFPLGHIDIDTMEDYHRWIEDDKKL
ncbi:nucleotidyltransferase family protein [Sinomicrobium sp. M5D2P9]